MDPTTKAMEEQHSYTSVAFNNHANSLGMIKKDFLGMLCTKLPKLKNDYEKHRLICNSRKKEPNMTLTSLALKDLPFIMVNICTSKSLKTN